MARFRSRPAECEAEQFKGFYHTPYPPGVEVYLQSCYVVTAHGDRINLHVGDWVVKEPIGDGYYPVKPDVFEKRWEPIS